jgi:Domain of unknown function (DUF4413)
MLLAIACVLDPRCKLTVVEYYFEQMYPDDSANFIANLRSCMDALFKEYVESHSRLHNQAGRSIQQMRY